MIIFSVTLCHSVKPPADQGEDQCADRQAECRSPDAALLVGVLEHLKGEGRDKCSGSERKHRSKHPLRERESPAGQGAKHQCARSDHTIEKRLSHAS